MSIAIRRIDASEWRALRELRLAALADSPEAFGQPLADAAVQPDSEWISAARAASSGDRRAWFIAWDGAVPVGLVQARRRPPDDCLVFSMWVSPIARRAGLGRMLLDEVDRWASGWGARSVVLWVAGGNDAATRFYERIGFTVVADGQDAEAGMIYGASAMCRPISLG
jgi:ribosomal protein S18 acetylase RimI-like enzyme